NPSTPHGLKKLPSPTNGDKDIGGLLQKRGAKYSSRPPSYYLHQILARNKAFVRVLF
ncbi:579_t:CDS:2, partial [Dentiscutata erythropus]